MVLTPVPLVVHNTVLRVDPTDDEGFAWQAAPTELIVAGSLACVLGKPIDEAYPAMTPGWSAADAAVTFEQGALMGDRTVPLLVAAGADPALSELLLLQPARATAAITIPAEARRQVELLITPA